MNHHAYLITGDINAGIAAAQEFVQEKLKLSIEGNPDVVTLSYGLFSVEDARTFQNAVMRAPVKGDTKVIIVAATRFFHEAQNALLKTFEEPPQGTYLMLVLPTEGIVLPTLRSRLHTLAIEKETVSDLAQAYVAAGKAEREKMIARLLDRTKSDKEEEKAAARAEALTLIEGLARIAYRAHRKSSSPELKEFLSDLDRFTPLLHDRAAPLKIIFEHISLVFPHKL